MQSFFPMKFTIPYLLSIILLCLASPGFALDARDREALELMDFAVRQTIRETGVEVIGVGSWTSQKNYKGPLSGGKSDHDMRVVLTGETDNKVLTGRWKDFRNRLKENITAMGQAKRLTGEEIAAMLNSANVYPPDQLVATVESAEDAQRLFARTGTKPNLGGEPVEGIWGPGSKAYKQYYEEKSGRLFYLDGKSGKVMSGTTDLTHMMEGVEKYTTAGEVNKAGQWADKVLEQLEEGNTDKAAKQAERISLSLNKARALERLGGSAGYLDDIIAGRVTDPEAIKAAVTRARNESSLLLALSREGRVSTRATLRNVLLYEGTETSKMSGLFWKYADKAPISRLFRAFQLYGYYASVRDTSAMTGADFNAAVLTSSGKELAWLTSGPMAGLGAELADLTLQMARQGAYNIVTAFQDCENLVAGVHSVKGREDLNKGMSLDQMVSAFPDTSEGRDRLKNFVWFQAYQASFRLENRQWVADSSVQNSLYQKCYSPIVNMWREKRLERIGAFNTLFLEFDRMAGNAKAVLHIEPSSNPIPLREQSTQGRTARVTLTGSVSQDQDKMADLVRKMNEVVKTLEGSAKDVIFAGVSYQLSLDGKAYDKVYKPVTRSFSFNRPGEHNGFLAVETGITGTILSEDVAKYGLLQGYAKRYPTTAVVSFSIAEESPGLRLRLNCPSLARTGRTYQLAAVVEDSGDIAPSSVKFAWSAVTMNKRLTQGYQNRINHSEQTPGRYEYLAEAFVQERGGMTKLGDARCIVEVEQERLHLAVTINGPKRAMQGQDALFTARVHSGAGTPQLTCAWYLDGVRLRGNSNSQLVKAASKGIHTVKTEVFAAAAGKWVKAGEAVYRFEVEDAYANCSISADRDRLKQGEGATLTGRISGTNISDTSTLYFKWTVDGRDVGSGNSYSYSAGASGTHTVVVELWMRKQPQPVRMCRTSRSIFVEAKQERKTISRKSNSELAQAEGQAICDCMNASIQRSNDRPGNEFVFKSRWKYDVNEQKCKGGSWSAKGVALSGDFQIGVVRGDYWDEKANACKGP